MNNTTSPQLSFSLNPTQRDICLDYLKDPANHLWTIGCSVCLGSHIDLTRWRHAIKKAHVELSTPRMHLLIKDDGRMLQSVAHHAPLIYHEQLDLEVTALDYFRKQVCRPLNWMQVGHTEYWLLKDISGNYHAAISAPHLFSDGHTMRIIFEKIYAHYREEKKVFHSNWTETADLINRFNNLFDQPQVVDHWRNLFSDVKPLNFRTSSTDVPEYIDDRQLLDAQLSARIRDWSAEQNIPLPTFFLGLYAILLQRFREVGSSYAIHSLRGTRNSTLSEQEGCFYEVFPYLISENNIKVNSSIMELFHELSTFRKKYALEGHLSMLAQSELIASSNEERQQAFCRAIFNFYDFGVVKLDKPRKIQTYFNHPHQEVHLIVAPYQDEIELRFRASTATLNTNGFVKRMANLAEQVLDGAKTIRDLDWLLPEETNFYLASRLHHNDLAEDVLALFQKFAASNPNAPAVIDHDVVTSYAELNAMSDRIAKALRSHGVLCGELVALALERSTQQIAAMLGILKAGAGYVPIDITYPIERIRFILDDCKAQHLITAPSLQRLFEEKNSLTVLYVESLLLQEQSTTDFSSHCSPYLPGYVIYTSGTTGLPKGVMIRRNNVNRLFRATREIFHFNEQDVIPYIHSLSFDFSVWEIWSALAYGGQLVIVSTCTARDPDQLSELILNSGVSVLNQTPSAFLALLASDTASGRNSTSGVRCVIFGGEELDPRKLNNWMASPAAQDIQVFNLFGITETTVHVTCRQIHYSDTITHYPRSPIGVPLEDLSVYVLDSEMQLAPTGVSGEMFVAGSGVASNYLNRPDLSKEHFLDDFIAQDGGIIYRTGDRGRLLHNGELDYLGRIDNQVQVRGFRVELAEIEHALRKHPDVKEACVVAHSDNDNRNLLHGYVTLSRDLEASRSDKEFSLHNFLEEKLPAYMQCHRICILDSFPLTAHGKIDKQKLPRVFFSSDSEKLTTSDTYASDLERLIIETIQEVLRCGNISRADDFFKIGGDSLTGVSFILKLRKKIGKDVPISILFKARQVSRLAKELRVLIDNSSPNSFVVEVAKDRSAMPLTFSQERVWHLQQIAPQSVAYEFNVALHFEGSVSHTLLEQALNYLVERHEIFRTTFPITGNKPAQCVSPYCPIKLPHHDCRNHNEKIRFHKNYSESLLQPLDLVSAPPIYWELVTYSDDKHTLFHREHHLLHDGKSFLIFVTELIKVYSALFEGKPINLPDLNYQIGDFADAHRKWVKSEQAISQLDYWKQKLAGAGMPLELPYDFNRPDEITYRGKQLRCTLRAQSIASMREICASQSTTLFCGLLAVFVVTLHRFSGSNDICVGSGVAGRTWPGAESLIGMLINNLPLRFSITRDATFSEALKQVSKTLAEALPLQNIPYEKIVSEVNPPRIPGAAPLAQIFFSAYEGEFPELELPNGSRLWLELVLPNDSAKFDLNVVTVSVPEKDSKRLDMIWEYSTDLFQEDTIRQLMEDFQIVLEDATKDPNLTISKLAVDVTFKKYLNFNNTQKDYPKDKTVHELFERQVLQRPDSLAIQGEIDSITYAQLDFRAKVISQALLEAEVKPGDCVALLLRQREDAIAAMLGVLQIGASYLPLHTNEPESRIQAILKTANAKCIVLAPSDTHDTSRSLNRVFLPSFFDRQELHRYQLPKVSSNEIAYVMHTSGSTGEPKPVLVPHRAIVRLLFPADYVQLDSNVRILQLAPLGFDASTFEIWGALLHGGTLIPYPDSEIDFLKLEEIIAKHQINTLWLTAALFNKIIDSRPQIIKPVRQILTGGEALSPGHVHKALRMFPDKHFINGYGPTESTTFACTHRITNNFSDRARIPIGKPLANTTAWILNDSFDICPVGAVGDLWLGGDGLAKGYATSQSESDRSFHNVKMPDGTFQRLYKTGDRARLRHDKTLDFLGRNDEQIKIRGLRIEPGEAAAALLKIHEIARAVVISHRQNQKSDYMLIAAVVLKEAAAINPEQIKSKLKEFLPAYLIPTRVLILNDFPLTAQGKLDRAALINLAEEVPHLEVEYDTTRAEIIVSQLWEKTLGKRANGLEDNFFEEGGSSLDAVFLLSAVSSTFNIHCRTAAFLKNPTIRGVVDALNQQESSEKDAFSSRHIVPLRAAENGNVLVILPGGWGEENELLVFANICRSMNWRGTIAGIRSNILHVKENLYPTVTSRAQAYCQQILNSFKGKALSVVGECVAAPLAFELACQLNSSGLTPSELILMDSPFPTHTRRYKLLWQLIVSRSLFLSKLFTYNRVFTDLPKGVADYYQSLWCYRPKKYNGNVSLIISHDLSRRIKNPSKGWDPLIQGRLRVFPIPGTHDEYVRKNASMAASVLDEILGLQS